MELESEEQRPRPSKEAFNVPSETLQFLMQKESELKNEIESAGSVKGFILFFIGVAVFSFLTWAESRNDLADIFAHFIMAGFVVAIVYWPLEFISSKTNSTLKSEKAKERQTSLAVVQEKIQNIRKYEEATKRWEYFNTATKEGFWQTKQGIQLERAVKELLQKKGWMTEDTKVTGDGGIDLISTKHNRKILIQCKGHSSALGVGAIRDAAGVKSTQNCDDMVVIATNGFTSGSVDFARSSGIKLVDSGDLANYVGDISEFPNSKRY